MRVLLVDFDLAPTAGGGFTLSQEIARALVGGAANGPHTFFVLDTRAHHETALPPEAGVTVLRTPLPSETGKWPAYSPDDPFWQFVKAQLDTYRVDCALSLIPWRTSPVLPNIVTVWDLEHRRKPYFPELGASGDWPWESRERLFTRILPRAIGVIAGTETGKRQIERFYGVDPSVIHVIPFPTPAFALEQAGREAPPLPAANIEQPFLFYPAQFWAHKNHVRLLQAMQLLNRDGWPGSVVLTGADKGNLPYVQRTAERLGVADRVRFLGFVSRDELASLYQHATALTYVSYLGPDNLPPLEAFALGCPVLASAVDGADELLGSAALMFDPDDAGALAAAVLRLVREPGLREQLIRLGKQRAQRFTVKDYVARLSALLDGLERRFECFRA